MILQYSKDAIENPKEFLEAYRKAVDTQCEKWREEGGNEWKIGFVTGGCQGHLDYWHYINQFFKNKTPEECLKTFKNLKPPTMADYIKARDKK